MTPGLPRVSMDVNIEYLLSYLQDELSDVPEVRIHPVAPSGTTKSPDLPQDYDPEEKRVHLNRGVRVRIGSRDYFFPVDWVLRNEFDKIRNQAREIREFSAVSRY
jgi:hypothetical protein